MDALAYINRLLLEKFHEYVALTEPSGKQRSIPVWVNPNESETDDIIKEDENHHVRFIVDTKHNIYAWPASLAMHGDMKRALGISDHIILDDIGVGEKSHHMYIKPKWYDHKLINALEKFLKTFEIKNIQLIDPNGNLLGAI